MGARRARLTVSSAPPPRVAYGHRRTLTPNDSPDPAASELGPAPTPPSSPEALTTEWLNSAVAGTSEFAGSRIVDFAIEPIGSGRGFTSKLVRVRLQFDSPGSAPTSLVAKFSTDASIGRDLIKGAYAREAVFYQRFQAETPIPSPRCYYVAYDPERVCFVLLLEDLDHLEGGDQIKGTSQARLRTAVRNLALLHSQFWNNPQLHQAIPRMAEDLDFADALVLFREGLDEFRRIRGDRYPRFLAVAEEAWRMISIPGFEPQQIGARRPPFTLLHGDYRLDNMFFADDDEHSITAIDWVVNVGRGGMDLGYFLYQSLTTEQLRQQGPALIELYRRTLREQGVRDYSSRRLRSDCEMVLGQLVGNQVLIQVSLARAPAGTASGPQPVDGDSPVALKAKVESFLATLTDNERGLPLFQTMLDRLEGALELNPGVVKRIRMAVLLLRVQIKWRRMFRRSSS